MRSAHHPPKANWVRFQTVSLHVGIELDDAAGQRVLSGISRFLILAFQRCFILTTHAYTGDCV
ncbi:hypothetical protein PR048_032084 [Dryococelus australis]|uniref:Uncharacterized protein n=1 Tax=Dryococelus australis TaxID=614101 RepID=A0ABQ9G177_9NEOP|nr:hypothetical protein PR048_032084 [Dryococelus australis]